MVTRPCLQGIESRREGLLWPEVCRQRKTEGKYLEQVVDGVMAFLCLKFTSRLITTCVTLHWEIISGLNCIYMIVFLLVSNLFGVIQKVLPSLCSTVFFLKGTTSYIYHSDADMFSRSF